ncbi:uncharacterized protein LOC113306007 [Papaver somniferum]|uniref:uncharacterized protein LOC113306007 n=1 Tax=Papaver somniferum TaxID=3469 RepID=UPI000E6FDD71|nr:uncharacterized protein LOC113306007 [Papaver somniferum]
MTNLEWLQQFQLSQAEFLVPGISDHSPVVVSVFEKRKHGPPPFRFYNFLMGDAEFLDIVNQAWKIQVRGNPMIQLVTKLKFSKRRIIELKKRKFKNVSEQSLQSKENMQLAQAQLQSDPLNQDLASRERDYVYEYVRLAKSEESAAKQNIFGDDFVAAVKNFFDKYKLLKEVNNNFIALVAKKENPNTVADFIPISCCNVVYKCITKIISLRMKKVLSGLISVNQSAFISGRAIQENIMVAHEIVRNYHSKKGSPRCALKLDLKKIYDTVSWAVLLLLAASPLNDFLVKSSNCNGLEMNRHNTCLFHSAIDDANLNLIVQALDCFVGDLPVRYLGVPLLSARLSYKDYIPLLEKIRMRVKTWKARFLAFPGRVLLIKAVLNGMVYFWLSCFVLPKKAIKELNTIFKRFLWDGPDLGKRFNPIRWPNFCQPYDCGDLGIKYLEITNVAANSRHIWDLVSGKVIIWTDSVKGNLIKDQDFWSMEIPHDSSW